MALDRGTFISELKKIGNDVPSVPLVGNPWHAAVDTLNAAIDTSGLGGKFDSFLADLSNFFTVPTTPTAHPINPLDAMEDLAKAIAQAEQRLNEQSLLILSGTVDAELVVQVGGVAGANAKIHLEIAPKN